MTDKIQKIREEVERLQKRAEHNFDISLTENDRQFWLGESNVLTLIGKYIDTLQKEPISEEFKIALEKKVREAQDWTYIEEEGGECPLNEEFGAYDLEEFAKWGANWQKEQLLAMAVDGTTKFVGKGVEKMVKFVCGDLNPDEYWLNQRVKLIIIKQRRTKQ